MAENPRKRPVFTFRPAAANPLTDYDVVMAYEVLLGRHPESAAAIAYHRGTSFPGMISGFLASDEFHENVAHRLQTNRPLARGDWRKPPSAEQLEWLFDAIAFTDVQQESLHASATWGEFFTRFLALGGVGPDASAAAPDPVTPADAILAQIEQVRELLAAIEAGVRNLGR